MSKGLNFQLPSLGVKDSEKNKEWHKQYVQAIVSRNINDNYSFTYSSMNECVNFYQGLQGGDEFNFIQEAEDGDSLPAKWVNYNKIKVKIDLLLGELSEKGYDITVKALNKDAKVRRLEEKKRLMVEMRLKDVARSLEETYKMPMQSSEFVPDSEEELDEYFDSNYKETSEIIMESAIKYIAKKNKWDYERLSMFRDLLIMGRCVGKTELVNDIPKTRRVDPRLFIFDESATDDFLSDSTFYGEIRYMNMGDAAQEYNLSKKELEEAAKTYSESTKGASTTGSDSSTEFAALDSSTLAWFRPEGGEMRVLVVSAVWVDTKAYNHKISVDKYGNEHIKKVKDTYKGDDLQQKRIKIWRKGTLIGGKFMREWGELDNRPTDIDNLTETTSPYTVLIPNFLNGHGISKVHQLKGLQDLKNIAMYNVQLAMARAGAKGFIYDTAQVPDDWDVHTVIKYLKSVGIAFINSKKDGIPATFNQFQSIDLSLTQSVTYLLEISAMVDREMDAISGINEARQGLVQNASQAVGVTQSALLQSSLSTATYYKLFEHFCTDVLNLQAKLVKIAWAGKEKFAPIIGDTGINFLETDIDLDLNDYGVFVSSVPPMIDDIQKFQEIVMAALQSGKVEFIDAIKLLREKDVTMGIRRLEKDLTKKADQDFQREKELIQEQQNQAAAAQDEKMQKEVAKQEQANAGALEVQKLKNQGAIQEILTEGRLNMSSKKIDIEKELAIIEKQAKLKSTQSK